VVGKACGLAVILLVNAQSIMHIVFQLYDVLRIDSTVVINVGYISTYSTIPKVKQANFFKF